MKQNKVLCVLVCVLSGIILLMIAGIVLILLSPDGEETSEYLAGSRGVIGFYGRGLTTPVPNISTSTGGATPTRISFSTKTPRMSKGSDGKTET